MEKTNYQKQFSKVLQSLNPEQKEAVDHIEGPVLVVAGPGTGKTQILSARIGNILQKTDSLPYNILCLTYTDAGTVAMRKRLLDFIGPAAYDVHIFTFHGFCNKVIQENLDYFGIKDLQPVSDLEKIEYFEQLIDGFDEDNPLKNSKNRNSIISSLSFFFDNMKKENWSYKSIKSSVDEYLEMLPTLDGFYYKRANKKAGIEKGDPNKTNIAKEQDKMDKLLAAAKEFDRFQAIMSSNGRYDYNDMIIWVLKAFQESEYLLMRYQEIYHYFLVDEFQDTNSAQNQILSLLSSYWEIPNVFVVGDDDQSIYRFQGANLKNILDFNKQYEGILKTVVLQSNYRSAQPILDLSRAVIDNNNDRLTKSIPGLTKTINAAGENKSYTSTPRVVELPNVLHEETFVLNEIKRLHTIGTDLSEVAILYRNHSQVDNLVKVLEAENIPLNVRKKVDILSLPLIKQIRTVLNYLSEEYLKPGSSDYLLFEIMHYKFWDIDIRDIAKISNLFSYNPETKTAKSWREIISDEKILEELNIKSKQQIIRLENKLIDWLQALSESTVQMLFEKILTEGKILEWIMKSDEKAWHMQTITTFFDFLKEESVRNPDLTLKEYCKILDRLSENNLQIGINKTLYAQRGVNFITCHSSKGLEFDHVYMIGCTSAQWEKKRARGSQIKIPPTLLEAESSEDKVEEERRLFFVGATRARKHLTFTYPTESNDGKALEQSRFIAEAEEGAELNQLFLSMDEERILLYNMHLLSQIELNDVPLIDHDLIDRSMENFRMSVTSLNKFLKCGLSFYFENILRVPSARNKYMGFGSAIHQALELFFKEMLEYHGSFPSQERLVELFVDSLDYYRSHFTPTEFSDFIAYGKQILPDYYEKYVGSWNKDVRMEYDIKNAYLNDVPLTGKLDKIEFTGDDINVIDYKTGNPDNSSAKLRRPSDKDPIGGDYWRQIVFYKILLDNDTSKLWNMVSGEMDFLEPSKKKKDYIKEKIVVTMDDITIVSKQITESYEKMVRREFEGCGKDDCTWCNFVKDNYSSENLELNDILTED